jgi:hypothetical protein
MFHYHTIKGQIRSHLFVRSCRDKLKREYDTSMLPDKHLRETENRCSKSISPWAPTQVLNIIRPAGAE